MNKSDLRIKAKIIRKSLQIKDISKKIVVNIRNLDVYKHSSRVMIFYPLSNEIDLLGLLNDTDKQFFLPKMNGDNLECCPFDLNTELIVSDFGVREPKCAPIIKSELDLVFVPALCVDREFYRLGYGKGFYDRFLSNFEGVSIVPIAEELIFDEIFRDEFDIQCDGMITQKKASFNRG